MTRESEKLRLALYHMSDSRRELLKRFTGGKEPTYADVAAVSTFITALRDTVVSRKRTELRGLGVLEWRPCSRKIPTGKRVETWRLVFRFCQKHKYTEGK